MAFLTRSGMGNLGNHRGVTSKAVFLDHHALMAPYTASGRRWQVIGLLHRDEITFLLAGEGVAFPAWPGSLVMAGSAEISPCLMGLVIERDGL